MKLLLPFSSADTQYIKLGQAAKVFVPAFMSYVDGTIVYVGSKPYYTPDGGMMNNVEIQVNNPGALEGAMEAGAEITVGDRVINSIQNEKLEYDKSLLIKAEVVGTIKKLNVRENQYVEAGELLVELQNEDLLFEKARMDLKIETLEQQLGSKVK